MTATVSHSTARKALAPRKLVWVGPVTIVVAAIVNLVIRAIATAFFGVSDGFTYFQPYYVIGGTVVYLLLAFLAFVLVGRAAQHSIQTYRLLALVALGVSFLSPLSALAGLVAAPGMNLHIFWTMVIMHTVSAIITVSLLTTLAVTAAPGEQTGRGA
ncbi:MAG TPA: hypothetical protein VKT82_06800 [Ktedonobacterales bacterium]|nr:hypothetical protein [Ktedonobacterales bacterium]